MQAKVFFRFPALSTCSPFSVFHLFSFLLLHPTNNSHPLCRPWKHFARQTSSQTPTSVSADESFFGFLSFSDSIQIYLFVSLWLCLLVCLSHFGSPITWSSSLSRFPILSLSVHPPSLLLSLFLLLYLLSVSLSFPLPHSLSLISLCSFHSLVHPVSAGLSLSFACPHNPPLWSPIHFLFSKKSIWVLGSSKHICCMLRRQANFTWKSLPD